MLNTAYCIHVRDHVKWIKIKLTSLQSGIRSPKIWVILLHMRTITRGMNTKPFFPSPHTFNNRKLAWERGECQTI